MPAGCNRVGYNRAAMGFLTVDMLDGAVTLKRGDLIQTNVGGARERTWIVLTSRALRTRNGVPRCKVWVERWWEMEPELRMSLYRSAERNGGQKVIQFKRYPAKKKARTFEEYMRYV
jgi:hypothetical protein